MKIQRAGTMEKPEVSPALLLCKHIFPYEFISLLMHNLENMWKEFFAE